MVAERRAVGKALAGALEHLDDRGVGIDVDGGRHARRALVIPEIGLHYYCPLLCLNVHCAFSPLYLIASRQKGVVRR
ncbi:hypothetical protein [Pseudomonas peli]|uniref:hypothetical protein n=1 Tax=Pseudomonas peli TaxID=592361 RepID=UPI0024AE74F7|nr:hypothetical protein [Pseudomonas peli]